MSRTSATKFQEVRSAVRVALKAGLFKVAVPAQQLESLIRELDEGASREAALRREIEGEGMFPSGE